MSSEARYADGKLTITRTYSAPRSAVFDAWVEASKVQQWWGCAQTTSVKSDIEKKVGGKYCHQMTIEGAGEYPMVCRITVYDPPNQLAYEDISESVNPMRVTVSFTECGNRTEVQLVHEKLPNELSDIVKGGWTAALGKLDGFLERDLAGAS